MKPLLAPLFLILLACGTVVAQGGGDDMTRVGIVPFGYGDSDSRWISNKLYDKLADALKDDGNYELISRNDLEKAFKEQGFDCSHFQFGVPPDFVVNAGLALDADMMVFGSVTPSGESYQVRWNITIPASGNTIPAEPSTVLKNSGSVEELARTMVEQMEDMVTGKARQALDQAAFSIQIKNWPMAIMFLKQALATDPSNIEAKFLLADVYLEEEVDSVDRALEIYREIEAEDPGNPDAKVGIGKVYLARGDAETAKDYFEDAVEIDPENADAYLGLARAYQVLGELDQAIASFENALAGNPDNLSIKFPLAMLYFQTEEYSKAIPYMEEILAVNGNMHGLRQRLIQSYVRTGQYGKAADHAAVYLEADPDNTQRILYTAQVEAWAGRTSSAVNRLESLIARTGSREAYILLASIYRDSGQRGAMQNVFSRLSSAYPNDPLANYMMGAFYYQSGSNKARISELTKENVPVWESAIAELNTAISYLSQVTGSRAASAQSMINAAYNSISLCEEKIDRVERYSQ